MKKLCFILTLFCISTSICGCGHQQKSYSIPSDFTKISFYQGDKGKYLGKNEGNLLSNVYELKKMSSSDYLYVSESYVVGNPKSDQYLLMKESVAEPILCYGVKKLEILQSDSKTIVIEDKQILNNLILLRKDGLSSESEYTDALDINTTFYFDLPCNLTWKCRIVLDASETVHLICFDIKKNGWYDYDATSVLLDTLSDK